MLRKTRTSRGETAEGSGDGSAALVVIGLLTGRESLGGRFEGVMEKLERQVMAALSQYTGAGELGLSVHPQYGLHQKHPKTVARKTCYTSKQIRWLLK